VTLLLSLSYARTSGASPERFDHNKFTGEPGSLAREMQGWLYRFRVIPRPGACRTTRDSLKTKTLVLFFQERNEPLSSLFHGKFFRCSQATENLRVQIDPRGLQDSSRI
jgi:hypothetical protein